tara:strand:- start:1394 stop:1669 length:276 start_codon:yes stop_codon:yes gene_type:complete
MKKVNTIQMSELLLKSDDIYKNVMISAKRARQIISDNFIDIEVLENADNLEELEKVEKILKNEETQPVVTAVNELLDNKLDWNNPVSNDDE